MIIGIEAERANHSQKTGVEHYAKQLIAHLAAIDRENTYVLYLRTKPEEWFFSLPKNFTVKVLPFPIFWTQLRLSAEILLHKVDKLFIPASALPMLHPKNSVVTIHDLAFLKYPESFTWFNRNFLKFSTWFAVHFAKKIIAVSESTKKDLQSEYGLLGEKISVVHHGFQLAPGSAMQPPSAPLPEKYILFLSTLQPRKNLEGLLEAFRLLKRERPELPHKLVVVGKPGWKYKSILQALQSNQQDVVYLHHIREEEKAYVLRHAAVLALPSFYEGFGMQILEAFEAGIPVVTANVSSMPEVAADAALYFDPHDSKDIKNALQHVLLDAGLRDGLLAKGRERLKAFSWQQCAQQTLAVLKGTA